MFVELLEHLRCPRGHEEAPLVATVHHTEARSIVDGVLGCPVCRAEFLITGGVAHLDDGPGTVVASTRLREHEGAAPPQPDPGVAARLAAFLDLTDARGFAILCGPWGVHAPILAALCETPLVLVNPPLPVASPVAGVLLTAGPLPLGRGVARAAALHEGSSPAQLASVLRAVRDRGRLVGPASLPVPAGAVELARDAWEWVAETRAAPGDPSPRLVTLRRA